MRSSQSLARDSHKSKSSKTIDKLGSSISADILLQRDVSEIPTLLTPIIPKIGLMGFAGSSDVGKSAFIRHFAAAVALGERKFLNMDLNVTHSRVLYVSSEDDCDSIAYLLQKLNKVYQRRPEDFSGLKFITKTDNLIERLEFELAIAPVDVIVLDTFGDLYSGGMNESNQVRSFLNEFSQLAQRHKCLVIVLHHTGKRTDDFAPSKNNLLGSQGFESKMRLVIELRLDRDNYERRHLCIVKGNYLPREFKEKSYVLTMNESFFFTDTNERVSFKDLGNSDKKKNDLLQKEVVELHKQGFSQKEIGEKLNKSQPTISRLMGPHK